MGKVNIGWNSRCASTTPEANKIPKYNENGILQSSVINDSAPANAVINKTYLNTRLTALKSEIKPDALYGSNNSAQLETKARMDNNLSFIIEREETADGGFKEGYSFHMGERNEIKTANGIYLRPDMGTQTPENTGFFIFSTYDVDNRPANDPKHIYDVRLEPAIANVNNLGNHTGYLGSSFRPWSRVYANTIYSPNGINSTSDGRLKTNISEDFSTLKELFKKLKPITYQYNYTDDGKMRIGFKAQDIETSLTEVGINPENFAGLSKEELNLESYIYDDDCNLDDCYLAKYIKDGILYTINYNEFTALNTAMIQDIQNSVDTINTTLENLGTNEGGTTSVMSVNGKTGIVELTAEDVSASPVDHEHDEYSVEGHTHDFSELTGEVDLSNLSISPSDIGAAAASHTHSNYVPKSGNSSISGTLTVNAINVGGLTSSMYMETDLMTTPEIESSGEITFNPYDGRYGSWVMGDINSGTGPDFRTDVAGRGNIGTYGTPLAGVYANNVLYFDSCAQSSDRRLKEDISTDYDKLIEFFSKLEPVTYHYKSDNENRLNLGFVAQDVEQALIDSGIDPDKFVGLVKTNIPSDCDMGEEFEDGIVYSLSYPEFIPLNTKMIQNQQKEINSLKIEISELKAQIEELKTLIAN